MYWFTEILGAGGGLMPNGFAEIPIAGGGGGLGNEESGFCRKLFLNGATD